MRRILLPLLLATILTGCASSQKASVYQTGQVQAKMKVTLATVVGVRAVEIEAAPTGAGAAAGATAGAVAGAGNGYGRGSAIGAVAGAVVGGTVGVIAEKALNSKKGVEILYRPDRTAETFALVQEMDDQNVIAVGDRVRILEGQFNVRAVRVSGGESHSSL